MKTPTTVLLVVIAALLAANLFVNLPEAKAQPSLRAAAVPHVIQVEPGLISASVYRLWSDGVIEYATWNDQFACLPITDPPAGMDWEIVPELVPLPPRVRITRIYTRDQPGNILLRLRSDNVVEQNHRSGTLGWCGWLSPPG